MHSGKKKLDLNFVPFLSERDGLQRLKNSESKFTKLVTDKKSMLRIQSNDALFSEEKVQTILEESKLTSENDKMYRRKLKNLIGQNLKRKLSR
jgi:hypothetical protein